jgi:hypothetical protein
MMRCRDGGARKGGPSRAYARRDDRDEQMPRGAARDVNAEKKDDFTDREYCCAFLSLLVRCATRAE